MTWLEALLLGILQGLTEFLPVSSSGHLELGEWLLGVVNSDDKTFAVVVHVATALAIIVSFFRSILDLIKGLFEFKLNDSTRYVGMLALSMVPILVVGLLFKDEIDLLFANNLLLVGCMFLLTSVLIFVSERMQTKEQALNAPRAFVIGLAQTVAILPGLSRSGTTITTALMLGIDRQEAARFSFLMVLVPILGAGLLEAKDLTEPGYEAAGAISMPALIVGFVAAFISGLLACRAMIALVRRSRLTGFAIYLVLVGLFTIGVALFGQS